MGDIVERNSKKYQAIFFFVRDVRDSIILSLIILIMELYLVEYILVMRLSEK